MLWQKIIVGEAERAIVFIDGRFARLLSPGTYRLRSIFRRIEVEVHSTLNPELASQWARILWMTRPQLVDENFTRIETTDHQVALLSVNGILKSVAGPGERRLFWKEPQSVTARWIDVKAEPEVPPDLILPLERASAAGAFVRINVPENSTGLIYLDGRLLRQVPAGRYAFWTAAGSVSVALIDLRRQILEVPGQEILTRDKVSIRVNIYAEYTVSDPLKAVTVLKNVADTLHRQLQLAVRSTLGKRTLDEVLADKVDIDPDTADALRAGLAEFGIALGPIALKDIILPGEIRDILNQVVAAEKQAQANLIRRREETAATRSLLNTARLMEDNPVLIRMKELETLERLTEKVGTVSIHGGFEGLLDQLLKNTKNV